MKEPYIIAWEEEGKETHNQILLNIMKSDECINETEQFRMTHHNLSGVKSCQGASCSVIRNQIFPRDIFASERGKKREEKLTEKNGFLPSYDDVDCVWNVEKKWRNWVVVPGTVEWHRLVFVVQLRARLLSWDKSCFCHRENFLPTFYDFYYYHQRRACRLPFVGSWEIDNR